MYDGTEYSLFHFSDELSVSLWLLKQYADQWCNDAKALQAYVRDQCSIYDQHSHKQPINYVSFCSVPHIGAVFQAWASKMDRQWLYRYPKCGDAPPVLVGDATAESIQKKFYCGLSPKLAVSLRPAHTQGHSNACLQRQQQIVD